MKSKYAGNNIPGRYARDVVACIFFLKKEVLMLFLNSSRSYRTIQKPYIPSGNLSHTIMTGTHINWRPDHLENDFIKLVPLNKDDFEKLYAVASDPLIWEQHPSKDRYKREVFQLFFDGAVAGNTAFLILDKANGNTIGSTRYYNYKPESSCIAVGYTFLAKAYWGGKYNQSCKKLLLDYAFQFVDKVYFHVGAANTRSQLAIQKTGAIKVNEVDFDHYGEKILHFEYMIRKEDWK